MSSLVFSYLGEIFINKNIVMTQDHSLFVIVYSYNLRPDRHRR